MRKNVLGRRPKLLGKIYEVLQTKNSHPSEISFGILALETNILPLLGHPLQQWPVGLEQSPELEQLGFMTQVGVVKALGSQPFNFYSELFVAPYLPQADGH